MSVYNAPDQTTQCSLDSVDTSGTQYSAENALIVQVVLTDPATLVGSYSPGDSIDAATAQTIARAVFDAVLAFTP
tara:strand:- start:323 stop:547 length:225 start_codon:yes stop_codon:yes gene_type:complete